LSDHCGSRGYGADGAWYCRSHALLVVAKTLVTRSTGSKAMPIASICALIAEVLPDVIRKVEEPKGY